MDKLKVIDNKIRGMELYGHLITLGIGLALMLFGYRIKKLAFFILWFLIGYNLTLFFMPAICDAVAQIAESQLWQTLTPIVGGLLLALLGFTIEKICISGICFFIVMFIVAQYFGTEIQTLAIGAIFGVVAGAVATFLMKPAVILATSLVGGYALALALICIFPGINEELAYFPMIGGFTAIGAIFQFLTTRNSS